MKTVTKLMTTVSVMALLVGAGCLATGKAEDSATFRLGAPFCDNMVLQRDMKVPVWGWSKPGAKVTVEFAGQKKKAKAGQDGKGGRVLPGGSALLARRCSVRALAGE